MPRNARPGDDFEISLVDDALTLDDGPQITLDGDAEDDGVETSVDEAERLAREELNEYLEGFKERTSREEQRVQDATDSEYWICLCFQTRQQKEEYLRKSGLIEYGDKYLDGMLVAEHQGITLEAAVPPEPLLRIDRRLRDLIERG